MKIDNIPSSGFCGRFVLSLLIAIVILVGELSCEDLPNPPMPAQFEMKVTDAIIKKEWWPPFKYVMETRDGLRIPLIGDYPPLEEKRGRVENVAEAVLVVRADIYDFREYHKKMKGELDRMQKVLGDEAVIKKAHGVPKGDFGWYMLISEIRLNDERIVLKSCLESRQITRVADDVPE